jgi:hypothetical protein
MEVLPDDPVGVGLTKEQSELVDTLALSAEDKEKKQAVVYEGELGEAQCELGDPQYEVGEPQDKVGEPQYEVGEPQDKVGEELGEELGDPHGRDQNLHSGNLQRNSYCRNSVACLIRSL